MPLKPSPPPLPSRFRSSYTHKEGANPGQVEMLECRVVNVDMVNWTVDVYAVFDQRRFFHVQVGAPYLHHSNGEGIYVMPELHAKCMLCLPADSSPPHVAYFLMAFENVDTASEEAPEGTVSRGVTGMKPSGASFAGGRPRHNPGDIVLRGRDGNFVVLRRGGVLEIGSTELCQRMCIPLSNTMVDVSENYYHHTPGGTEYWGILPGRNEGKSATEHFQSFRVWAEDKFADVRVKIGKVGDPAKGLTGNGVVGDVVYEVSVAPQGIDPESGAYHDVNKLVYRMTVDREGNTVLGAKQDLTVYAARRLRLESGGSMTIQAKADIDMKASSGVTVDGGAFTTIRGSVVKLGPGAKPVATQGSMVRLTFPFTPMMAAPERMILNGIIITGSPTVLA